MTLAVDHTSSMETPSGSGAQPIVLDAEPSGSATGDEEPTLSRSNSSPNLQDPTSHNSVPKGGKKDKGKGREVATPPTATRVKEEPRAVPLATPEPAPNLVRLCWRTLNQSLIWHFSSTITTIAPLADRTALSSTATVALERFIYGVWTRLWKTSMKGIVVGSALVVSFERSENFCPLTRLPLICIAESPSKASSIRLFAPNPLGSKLNSS